MEENLIRAVDRTRTITAPTFLDWLRTESVHPRGEVGYLARHVTADYTDGCLTATDPAGVRAHAITEHHADQHRKARAVKALDHAERGYARHLHQLADACRRTRYVLLPAPTSPSEDPL